MQRIPITAQKAMRFSITLGGQRCQISITQRSTGVFLDLSANGAPIVAGAICLNRTRIVRYPYLDFIGDLVFVDTQGNNDPTYDGFGSRYLLVYMEAADL